MIFAFIKRISILVASLIFLSIGMLNAQEKITFLGKVLDSASKKHLSHVSLNIIHKESGKLVGSSYTDSVGRFSFVVDTGNYRVSFNVLGYKSKDLLVYSKIGIISNLFDVYLQQSIEQLNVVTISGTKKLIEQDGDKITYNVQNDPMAKTGNVTEILRRTPLIHVDGEGNVQVSGKSSFKILLNGRETATFSRNVKEALNAFPSAVISKIEVITSPSSKYDAEGTEAVINIITKKAIVGYNGYLSSNYSTVNYAASTNFSARKGKFGITGTYTLNGNQNNPSTSYTETLPTSPSTYYSRRVGGNKIGDRFYNNGNLEAVFAIDSLKTLVLYGSVTGGSNSTTSNQHITTELINLSISNQIYNQDIRNAFPEFGIGAEFIKKYNVIGKEFSVKLNSIFARNNGYNNSFLGIDSQGDFRNNKSDARNKEYTFQTDYMLPLDKNWKLETGVKTIFRLANSVYESYFRPSTNEYFERDDHNSNRFNYGQQVYSGYGSFNFSIRKLKLRLGARIEHTEISVAESYDSFIPDVLLSVNVSKIYALILTYTKRLQRPYITNLNPFINNNDPLNISFGNPRLDAQQMHTVSIQNRIIKGNFFSSLTLNGAYANNAIVQYPTFNAANGITSLTYGNVGKSTEGSVSLSSNVLIGSKLRLNTSASLRYNKIVNSILPHQQAEGFSGIAAGSFSYKLIRNIAFSGSGGIYRPAFSLLSNMDIIPFYQINSSYNFFKQKLSVNINANNFLGKWYNYHTQTTAPGFRMEARNTALFRIMFIGLTYNFGQMKEKVSQKSGVNNDDILR